MDELIDKAGQLDAQIKALNSELTEIKNQIKKEGAGSYDGSDYVAVVTTRNTRKLNQEKALAVAKKLNAKWLLKEVVDEEKLEDSLASGELDAKEFAGCIDSKPSMAITFKKRKG